MNVFLHLTNIHLKCGPYQVSKIHFFNLTISFSSLYLIINFQVVDDGSIMVTGGTDSRLVVWHDRTEEVRISEAAASQTKALQDQQLQNLLQNEQLLPALKMSITLERPNTALKIIQSLFTSNG